MLRDWFVRQNTGVGKASASRSEKKKYREKGAKTDTEDGVGREGIIRGEVK